MTLEMSEQAHVMRAAGWDSDSNEERDQSKVPLTDSEYDALAHEQRQHLLRYLTLNKYMVSDEDAAEQIAAWEQEIDREEITAPQRKKVQVQLYHNHLPRLRDAGLVSYDKKSGMIALTERAQHVIKQMNL